MQSWFLGGAEKKCDIGTSAPNCLNQLYSPALDQLELYAAMPLHEVDYRVPQVADRRREVRSDDDRTRISYPRRPSPISCAFELLEHLPRPVDELVSGLGRLHAARSPFKQRYTEGVLKRSESPAQRRRANTFAYRRKPQVTALGDGYSEANRAKLDCSSRT